MLAQLKLIHALMCGTGCSSDLISLSVPKHGLRNLSKFCLRAHTLAAEPSLALCEPCLSRLS